MPILHIFGMLFEWHDTKFDMVYEGREISFEEACSVFTDDYAITAMDNGDYGEQRMITVGMSNQARILTIVWVERDETTRIITAFKPTHTQKKRYLNYAKF